MAKYLIEIEEKKDIESCYGCRFNNETYDESYMCFFGSCVFLARVFC